IRYPGSPRPKRCELGVGGIDPVSAAANALSSPPGKYGRKIKTQRNRRGPAQAAERGGLFEATRRNLPGVDILWKTWWKPGPPARDRCTGGAWLSSARAVRCWVKSRNERNPCP